MLQALAALAMTVVIAAAGPDDPPQRTLVVQLIHRCSPKTTCLSSRIVALMKNEAQRVWFPLDVRLTWIDPAGAGAPGAYRSGLTVMLEEGAYAPVASNDSVLAALTQPADPCEWGLARVWVRHLEQHAALARGGEHAATTLPAGMADLFLGRALGRALAHEIGHYLLGTREHSAHGLMRPQFSPQDLLEGVTRTLYGLDSRQRAKLTSCRTMRDTDTDSAR